jgi:hypothetical protein
VDEVILPAGVRRFLDEYHHARQDAAWRPQRENLAELGRAVVPGGLAEALASGVNPPLVISTGNVLGPVPIAALIVGGRYLAELGRIAVVPSLALWASLRLRAARSGRGTLAFLDPRVPGTRREEAALRETLAPVQVIGSGEVHDRLADAGRYAAVVISAHGTPPREQDGPGTAGGPRLGLDQALVLGPDERLTAAQLLGCKLPDAVVTASCWSGRLSVRTAVEPLGLPTAALLAGARWVLAGTVDIGTSTTATLLGRFYRNLAAGLSPVAALQQVQVNFVRLRPQTAPGTWAGLTIIGDGFVPLPFTAEAPRP